LQKLLGFRAMDEIENDIDKMMKDEVKAEVKKITSPTLCFVTFMNHEAQHLCYLLGKEEAVKAQTFKRCSYFARLCGC
jgi:hypothetical protein